MNFRDALAAFAVLIASGAAHAQSTPLRHVDRVVVDVAGKPTPRVRAELLRASEAVCAFNDGITAAPSTVCVDATFRDALAQARAARAARAPDKPAQVASR